MALIKCPECKKKISDQCSHCPHCGYPIKNNEINLTENAITKEQNVKVKRQKKPLYKRIWFWMMLTLVLLVIGIGAMFMLNREAKPKMDAEGKPIYVEYTDEVYTNAKKYLGYHVNIKGKVFQVLGDNGEYKGVQVWLDPENSDQNVFIYYDTDAEVKEGDYIKCSGYIASVRKYKNTYGTYMEAPLLYATSYIKQSSYIEVVAPTTEIIEPGRLEGGYSQIYYQKTEQNKYGYSFNILKVEFSDKETRVYVKATNYGKASLYVGNAFVVQYGKQYNPINNYEANYEEIPSELIKGAESTGIIVFPPLSSNGFTISINVQSGDSREKLGTVTMYLSKNGSNVVTPWPTDE